MLRDSEIVERIRQGDKGQFETLFRSSYSSLVRYAGTLVRDYDTAEEIVQDLFFRIWKEREKLNIESSLNGYLYRAVHNRCLHHIEHLKVKDRYSRELMTADTDTAETPSDLIQYSELQSRIAAIL
ncbi:MAG: sigma factor, partial [Bacteroidales bacterium]